MPDNFSDLLDQCLADIAAGRATPESCAAAYPQYADQLLPLLRVSEMARTVPASSLRLEKRQAIHAQLLARAAHLKQNGVSSATQRTQRSRRVFRWLPVAAAVMLICSLLSVGVVSASAGALPGEALYPIKRLTEDAMLTFTPPSGQTDLHIYLAERRLGEYQALATQGDVRQELFDEVTAETTAALSYLTASSAATQQASLERILSATDQQAQVLSAVTAKAPEAARPGLLRALSVVESNRQQAMSILGTEPTPAGLPNTNNGDTPTPETTVATDTPTPDGDGHGAPTVGPDNSNKPATPPGQGTPGPRVTPPGQARPQNTPPGQVDPGPSGGPPGQTKDKDKKK